MDENKKDTNVQAVPNVRLESVFEGAKAEMQVGLFKGGMFSELTKHIASPFDISTPKEKVKKRPDGYDYIESSWMDKEFKSHSPLYDYDLLHYSENHGWVTCLVKLTDRITGNSELGAASVRIQVRQGTGTEPTFKDIVDKGNNVAAVLTRACKNAQSRFGHGADIYGKREAVRTEEENLRYDSMMSTLKKLSPNRAKQFEEGWTLLGADFSDYLDRWNVFVEKIKPSVEVKVTDGIESTEVKFN